MSQPMDRRLTPARPEIADLRFKGVVEADRYAPGVAKQIVTDIAPLRQAPRGDARLDTQVLYGEIVTFYGDEEGWAFIQCQRDGYCGWVPVSALHDVGQAPTHRVSALRTFLYMTPSIKEPPLGLLSMGSPLAIVGEEGQFFRTDQNGFVIRHHLREMASAQPDYAGCAERFLGTPYLWGGRTSLGLDCSGLVQTVLEAANIAAPRDTDMQEAATGTAIDPDGPLRRGDLVFWKGHVGLMLDGETLIHANGFHMDVTKEPLAEARRRILASGTGPVTSVKRL